MNRKVFFLGLLAATVALRCSSAPAPAASPGGAAPAPTPGAVARVNPYVVEETDTYTIQRYPKAEYIKVDDRQIRHPILGVTVEYFREDADYYYVSTPKHLPEEEALRREIAPPPPGPTPRARATKVPDEPGPPLSDFTDLQPPRVTGRVRLEKAASGLPVDGHWRSSFEIADMNEDGIPDIVAPPSRISGNPMLHIWIGNGKGAFTRWPLRFTEAGKAKADPGIDYGGVAVGDIDRDGHLDVATASHTAGLAAFFGDGKGGFHLTRAGLPAREFSAQAIALTDADGDGHLDIVASRDVLDSEATQSIDMNQVRVYLYKPVRLWEPKLDGIVGGFYSNSLHSWDYDGDKRKDVLTASHYNGALTLLWKNDGNGKFSPISFPDLIEIYAFHFATAPGTHGKDRAPAFVDSYYMSTQEPEQARAAGLTLYAWRGGKWERHRVWRKKDSKTLLYGVGIGDLDGDGLDDVVFPDSETRRLLLFLQQPDGTFVEAAESEEPLLDSPGQCVRLADLDKDGDLDIVLSKTVSSSAPRPEDRGGWDVYLNRR